MKLQQACEVLTDIESSHDVNGLVFNEICIWPLIRQTLWFQLLSVRNVNINQQLNDNRTLVDKLGNKLDAFIKSKKQAHTGQSNLDYLFISRPVYLQKLEDGCFIDRIIDPLIHCLPTKAQAQKIYTSKVPQIDKLKYSGIECNPTAMLTNTRLSPELVQRISDIVKQALLDNEKFWSKFNINLDAFLKWRKLAEDILSRNRNLKTLFCVSWYFPDMMGFVSIANKYGIKTIDVQHGKQGRYQGMYSWWTKTPTDGYELMPKKYWCWGKPSCNHIESSNSRENTGKAFIGGYPWVDYYKRVVRNNVVPESAAGKSRVLVTLQAAFGENQEPIPDFILYYLASDASNNSYFTFRCHPNFIGCIEYVRQRLNNIDKNKYAICNGNKNLYDEFLVSSHHITAYSSCCYEASLFHVPTLLFGKDARDIYKDEINSGEFSWTQGKTADLEEWLINTSVTHVNNNNEEQYIISSLDLSADILRNAETV